MSNVIKFPVTDRALQTLEKVMDKQDGYGIKKYKTPLNHMANYSWLDMFLEEIADGLKYIQCEVDRKEFIVTILESALVADNPKDHIRVALDLLTIKGTGK